MNATKPILAISALLVPVAALAQPVPKPKPTPPAVAAAAVAPAPVPAASAATVTVGGVTLRYPAEFVLAESAGQVATQGVIPPCDPGFDACLYYGADTYAGTNFETAGLRIGERADLVTPQACVSEQPDGYAGLVPTVTPGPGYSVAVFADIGDAGAGHYAEGTLYRLTADGACYEFETRIGQTQLANYDPGTIRPFTDEDEAAVEALFRWILETVALPDGTAVTFPSP